MTTFGVSMVRDEADIIGPVIDHMLTQVDHIIIADNGSIDGTRDILASRPVTVLDDPGRGYYQSQKMTGLAQLAADAGATWIVPFDADEVWYSPFGRIADILAEIAPQWLVATAALYDHVATGHDDPDELNPLARIGWRRHAYAPLHKVACRSRDDLTIEQGNHAATYIGGATTFDGQLVVRHFPYRDAEQFARKARNGAEAYEATDLPEELGAHWRSYGRILRDHGPNALAAVFREWFWVPDPTVDESLIFDPAPWTSQS